MRDILIFVFVMIASAWLYFSGGLESFITSLGTFMNLGVLVSGIFYAFGVTCPLAIAMFSTYVNVMSPLRIAMAASVGAMLADVVIFMGLKDVMKRELKIGKLVIRAPKPKNNLERYALLALGGILLAIPLPDEVALIVIGFTRIELNRFMALSLVAKFVGILGVAWTLKIF